MWLAGAILDPVDREHSYLCGKFQKTAHTRTYIPEGQGLPSRAVPLTHQLWAEETSP